MRIIQRIAALGAVLAMPGLAYGLARVALTMWGAMGAAPPADAGAALEQGLALAAAVLGAAIASYLALTGYAMLLGSFVRGGRAIPRALAALAPAGWTRVTAAALGIALSAGLATPALASEPSPYPSMGPGWVAAPIAAETPSPTTTESEAVAPNAGSPVLMAPVTIAELEATAEVGVGAAEVGAAEVGVEAAPPVSPAHPPVTPPSTAPPSTAPPTATPPDVTPPGAPPTPPSPPGAYVVQPGDSLWRITEALLGDGATESEIAAAWPALYDANRNAIGADPSLIHPGLNLAIPVGLTS